MQMAQSVVPKVVTSPQDFFATYAIGAVFVLSGFSGLVYEVVFAKSLALTFGSTAIAATTVLSDLHGRDSARELDWRPNRIFESECTSNLRFL